MAVKIRLMEGTEEHAASAHRPDGGQASRVPEGPRRWRISCPGRSGGRPENDQFVVVSEHGEGSLVYDPNYLGIERTDDVIFIQITLNEGRPVEKKKDLYKKIAELLTEKTGVRPEDLMINLVEVSKANWSYGYGEAQYVS